MISDRFTIEEQIATGSIATVYRAIDHQSQRLVSVNVLHSKNKALHKWFAEVSKAVSELKHPSIIQIYGVQKFEQRPALIAEFIETGTLGGYMTRSRLKLSEALLLTAQIASALDHAHAHDILHREVRPENMLVRLEEGNSLGLRVILTNWGMAQMAQAELDPGTVVFEGTLPYMSPEAVYGHTLDSRTDIFSLGVVLYLLTTGHKPSQARTEAKFVNAHFANSDVTIPAHLPVRVGEVLVRALAVEREQRFQNGMEMSEALEAIAATLTQAELAQYGMGKSLVLTVQKRAKMTKKSKNKKTVLVDKDLMEEFDEQYKDVADPSAGRRVGEGDGTNQNKTLIDLPDGSRVRGSDAVRQNDLVDDPRTDRRGASAEERNRVARMHGAFPKRKAAPPPQERILVQLLPNQLRLDPGESEQIIVNLQNLGPIHGDYSLKVKNNSESMRVDLSHRTVALAPKERTSVTLTVHAPKHSRLHAGEHPFRVLVASNRSRSKVGEMDGRIIVTPFEQFSFQMQPQRVKQNKTTQVIIKNEGNVAVNYRVTGRDQTAAIDYDIVDPVVEVAPGEEQSIPVKLSVHERSWFGKEERYPFDMTVRTTAGDKRKQRGTLLVQPKLPTLYLAIGGVALLSLLILSLVFRFSGSSDTVNYDSQNLTAAQIDQELSIVDGELRQAETACSLIQWLPRAVKNVVTQACRKVRTLQAAQRELERLKGTGPGSSGAVGISSDGNTSDPAVGDNNTTTGDDPDVVLEGVDPVDTTDDNAAATTPDDANSGTDSGTVNSGADSGTGADTGTNSGLPEVGETIVSWEPVIDEPIGTTFGGQSLLLTTLGRGENAFLLIGGIHSGSAPSTVQIAEAVETHFDANRELVPEDSTLYIISDLNPDSPSDIGGRDGRYNSRGVDLNRNFDCQWVRNPSGLASGAGGGEPLSEAESRVVEDLVNNNSLKGVIVLGAAGGSVIPGGCGGATTESQQLATIYADGGNFAVSSGGGVTGDITDWLASTKGVPAVYVLVSNHADGSADIDSTIRAVTAVLENYR